MRSLTGIIVGMLSFGLGFAGDAGGKVTLTQLTDHLFKINAVASFDVNFVASVGPDGVLLVDTGFKETAEELKARLLALGRGGVRFVINTHAHVDHTGGNRAFGEEAVIISHPALREKIRNGRYLLEESPPTVLPDLTASDGFSLHFNGEEIRVTALPGSHDNDDLVVHFTQSKVVYMGDLAYGLHYPTYDTDTGDATKYAEVVARALELLPDDVTVVSGHGKECSIPEMREYQEMLAETTRIVLEELKRRTDPASITPDLLGKWGGYAGQYQDASEWIRSLVQSVEDHGKPEVDLIGPMYLAWKSAGISAARGVFDEIVTGMPDDYHLELYLFGKFLAGKEAWRDAVTIFELANEAFPENPYVWLFWALQADSHRAAGERDEAVAKYRKSLELNPDYKGASKRLNELLEHEAGAELLH